MRAVWRSAALALVLAVGWTASAPCPPSVGARESGSPVAHSHLADAASEHGPALTAPCRCGCGDSEATRPGARAGFALASAPLESPLPARAPPPPTRTPTPPAAPCLGIDPVPV